MASVRLSVSDFIALTNQTLEFAYPSVEIVGEVQSFKVNQDKYVFFDLKDERGSIGCFMTVWQLRSPIEDRMKIMVTAMPKLTNWGKFSVTVKNVQLVGEGTLKRSFELLKARLEKEGLFSNDRKRPLPQIPAKVAVISSAQAAGYADFIAILENRWGGMNIEVAQVAVQGVDAPQQMIKALEYFNQAEELPDVIAMIRGGGSLDDLSAFNDEPLIRAIAASRVPVIVGVGHETDTTLADMAADVRAVTPSNAAQLLVPDKREVIYGLHASQRRVLEKIEHNTSHYEGLVAQQLSHAQQSIVSEERRISHHLASLEQVLAQVNPRTVLKRGYAIVRGEPQKGSQLKIELEKVIVTAEVQDVTAK